MYDRRHLYTTELDQTGILNPFTWDERSKLKSLQPNKGLLTRLTTTLCRSRGLHIHGSTWSLGHGVAQRYGLPRYSSAHKVTRSAPQKVLTPVLLQMRFFWGCHRPRPHHARFEDRPEVPHGSHFASPCKNFLGVDLVPILEKKLKIGIHYKS